MRSKTPKKAPTSDKRKSSLLGWSTCHRHLHLERVIFYQSRDNGASGRGRVPRGRGQMGPKALRCVAGARRPVRLLRPDKAASVGAAIRTTDAPRAGGAAPRQSGAPSCACSSEQRVAPWPWVWRENHRRLAPFLLRGIGLAVNVSILLLLGGLAGSRQERLGLGPARVVPAVLRSAYKRHHVRWSER